jgi:hypothetical protein
MITITTTQLSNRRGWSGCIKRESEGRLNGRCGGESGEDGDLRMGVEIMRGGRNREYDGKFWRGEMTGWSKEGSRENYVEIGKWEEFREGEGRRQLEWRLQTRAHIDGVMGMASTLQGACSRHQRRREGSHVWLVGPTSNLRRPESYQGASESWRRGAL